jgi:AcrR family transcriptional regulator
MKESRVYTMRARAQSAAGTRTRILESAAAAMRREFRPAVRLDAVAVEAGVSVQTVLRLFGSKDRLLDEVTKIATDDVAAEFADVRAGDVAGIVHAYLNHYEKVGDLVVRNIQDEQDPEIHAFVEHGRAAQRAGICQQFAPFLEPLAPADVGRVVDLLVVALDVYTWKRLRRDMGRSRPDVEAAVRALVTAILEVRHE